MNRKLLFFDVDGTIYDGSRCEIPSSTIEAVRLAHEQGHLVFINTGRTACWDEPDFSVLHPDGFVYGCGARVELGGELIMNIEMDHEEAEHIMQAFRRNGIRAFYESNETIYVDDTEPELPIIANDKEYLFRSGVGQSLRGDNGVYGFVKILLFTRNEEEKRLAESIMGDRFRFIDRENGRYEVILKDYSKATGMQVVCARLGATREDCFAFGDSSNDLDMLRYAAVGIAMGNGEQVVKDVCDYVTDDIQNDGILKAMKHYGLIDGEERA